MLKPSVPTARAGIAVHAVPPDECNTALANSGVSISIVPGAARSVTGSPVGLYVISIRYAFPSAREPAGTAGRPFGAVGVILTATAVAPARGAIAPRARSMTNCPSGVATPAAAEPSGPRAIERVTSPGGTLPEAKNGGGSTN